MDAEIEKTEKKHISPETQIFNMLTLSVSLFVLKEHQKRFLSLARNFHLKVSHFKCSFTPL